MHQRQRSITKAKSVPCQGVRTRSVRQGDTEDELHRRTDVILNKLKKLYPKATIELNYSNPFELLVATILSAQCTDVRVNQVTALLFKEFPHIDDYLENSVEALEKVIRPTGFFRQKAKSIRNAAQLINGKFGGQVPNTMVELVTLPGVGRKTANVILGNAFGIPGLPVDTHVIRLSNRLGLTQSPNPEKIEHELCSLLPSKEWTLFSHLLIWHGRRLCRARKPACESCPLQEECQYFKKSRQ